MGFALPSTGSCRPCAIRCEIVFDAGSVLGRGGGRLGERRGGQTEQSLGILVVDLLQDFRGKVDAVDRPVSLNGRGMREALVRSLEKLPARREKVLDVRTRVTAGRARPQDQ